jgi:Tfp pilus assembly protein PilX
MGWKMNFLQKSKLERKRQEGTVLLMVLLLVVMFTGIGLLAIRHIRGEMRAAGAYRDSVQAAAVAEAAIALAATDMRLYWDYTCDTGGYNYYTQFLGFSGTTNGLKLKFSPAFRGGAECADDPGQVPDTELSGSASLAKTSLFSDSVSGVTIEQDYPINAPAPPGFSSKQENQTYGFYYFNIQSSATYGHRNTPSGYEKGEAIARSRMLIGPILAFN